MDDPAPNGYGGRLLREVAAEDTVEHELAVAPFHPVDVDHAVQEELVLELMEHDVSVEPLHQ